MGAILLDNRTIDAVIETNWPAASDAEMFASEYRELDPSLYAAVRDGRLEMGDHISQLSADMELMQDRAMDMLQLAKVHGENPLYARETITKLRELLG